MENSFFNKKDVNEGNVAVGKLPDNFKNLLENITNNYNKAMEYQLKNNKFLTKHVWYDDMNQELKLNFNQIRNDEFWVNLCDGEKCNLISVPELDELMYSYAPPSLKMNNSVNLYGDTNAFEKHIDCDVCNFNGVKFYRVLIGLTDNKYVTTVFNNLNIKHKIQKNDFIIFDFGKTTHQVITDENKSSPRLFMKIHFLINENNTNSHFYLWGIKQYHIIYYKMMRSLQNETGGRHPSNFKEFFWGLMSHFYYNNYTKYVILIVLALIGLFAFKMKYIKYKILFIIISLLSFYTLIVTFYWMRYIVFNIR
jgi:hypothetical protein